MKQKPAININKLEKDFSEHERRVRLRAKVPETPLPPIPLPSKSPDRQNSFLVSFFYLFYLIQASHKPK